MTDCAVGFLPAPRGSGGGRPRPPRKAADIRCAACRAPPAARRAPTWGIARGCRRLPAIELDDQLLAQPRVDLLAAREADDPARLVRRVQTQPIGRLARRQDLGARLEVFVRQALRAHGDDVPDPRAE